jgi:DNA mismatch repair protein MutS
MKPFITDKQTLDDLNLVGKYKPKSFFSLFNKVKTAGGERLLDEMFRHPLTDAAAINRRVEIFRYYQQKGIRFEIDGATFREAEAYLTSAPAGAYPAVLANVMRMKLLAVTTRDERYSRLEAGVQAATVLLQKLFQCLLALADYPYPEELALLQKLSADHRLARLAKAGSSAPVPVVELANRHHLLRQEFQQELEQLLDIVYRIDLNIAVADVARELDLSWAQAVPATENRMEVEGLRHPALVAGVANAMHYNSPHHLLFLTGANMAGKSTIMKAFGIAVYMAHMGFPVAVTSMQFSVRDGLFTSINVPDNLNMGYSHFYAEVLRVKKVALEVAKGLDLVVIFDELFKGTNVKDAYDATLSVTKAFGRYPNCIFIVSTHIIEVGEALRRELPNALFRYMPTIMEGAVPRYPYTLTDGITNDRQGMMIVENEGIFDLLG